MPTTGDVTLYASALNLPVFIAAAEDDGTFHPPSLDHEFNLPGILFDGTPFELNRILLVRLLAIAVMVFLFWLALRKPTVVPGKGQSIAELALGFVKDQIADGVLGEKLGRKYLPLLAAMFFGIFAMNITGIIPGLNIAGTSLIGMPIVLAVVAYIAFIYAGFKEAGAWTFFRNALFPPGVPVYMYILLTPIEFVNIFVVRPVSLALRLFLNMMVGHLLLVLCYGATWFFVITLGGADALFGIPTLLGGFVMTLVEMLASILQAFVFTLLTAVFIQQAAAKSH
ncbi:F-type H+-transporting ATPase subunit a [Pseudoclavibacter chungangensis]|uniref:F0F1 ATP synthase subunit A n=1 Tax=Pseudoclavibacter chungangensis TaxID=587635 RepID=UPI00184ADB9A|nr:F0F1 ATP synthase subunit A [Pseudoclavibacter chungangensis]NYJ66228.1 F-type H+-transporting ATPase subunit a [Pseudoclavibacter chungangensis]